MLKKKKRKEIHDHVLEMVRQSSNWGWNGNHGYLGRVFGQENDCDSLVTFSERIQQSKIDYILQLCTCQ